MAKPKDKLEGKEVKEVREVKDVKEVKKGVDSKKIKTINVPKKAEIEAMVTKADSKKKDEGATRLFDSLFLFAHKARASDIHFEPGRAECLVRLRIDGILRDEFVLPVAVHARLISLLKIRTHMRTDEHRAPQDGRYQFSTSTGDVDIRASVMPVSDGEKAVLRLLSAESHKLTLEQLGFSEKDHASVEKAVKKPWGMILATGPTGSGKTTTIYAILEILNKRGVNISTIEDPVEFYIPGVNQSQVDRAAKLTFASGLRTIVRQDPDIMMVGEIRDEETAKIAVNAALTGHKLLSTLHTNNAATTIPRLLDMKVEPFLLASTLIVSVAQRLMRRVCTDCWSSVKMTKKEAADILEPETLESLFEKKSSVSVAKVKGCKSCGETGYHGRVGIFEVLSVNEEIQKLIIQRATSEEINAKAIEQGMTSLAEDGIKKVLSLETTLEEYLRVMQE